MTLREKLKQIKPDQWLLLWPSQSESLMTGLERIGACPDGTLKARYTDGEIEDGKITEGLFASDTDDPSIFFWLGELQDQRESGDED